MVLGLVHRLGGHGLAHVGIEGQAEHGDALQALLLQRLKELGADEDQPLDQGWAREVHLRRLERAVQVVHDVDELQQQPLVPGVEPALDVAGGSVAEGLVLGLELPVGFQHLVQPVLGEAGALRGRIGRGGFVRFEQVGEPSRGLLGRRRVQLAVFGGPLFGHSPPELATETLWLRPIIARGAAARACPRRAP